MSSSSIVVICIGDRVRAQLPAEFRATALEIKPFGAFPRDKADGYPYVVFGEGPYQDGMHPSWFHECIIVPTASGADVRGARTRYMPVPTVEKIRDALNEFAAGAELRDSLRDLKQEVKRQQVADATKLQSTDDIVAMTLREEVQHTVSAAKVHIKGFPMLDGSSSSSSSSAPTFLGATLVPADQATLVITVHEGASAGSLPALVEGVNLFQPDADATAHDHAMLWRAIDTLDDPSALFIPHGCSPEQFELFVLLALQRKRSRHSHRGRVGAMKPILQAIEQATTTLQVTAENMAL